MSDEPDDLRALLADVPEPDADRRERALAAAMAAFDQQMAPRRHSTRWLMPVDAALMAVGALGGVISQLGSGDDDDTTAVQQDNAAARRDLEESEDADDRATVAAPAAPVTEMMAAEAAADAAGAAPSSLPIPTVANDGDVVDVVRAARLDDQTERQVCDRSIVATALDERDPANVRLVLLAVEPGGSDETDEVIVVLAPDGDPDACTELDRIALP